MTTEEYCLRPARRHDIDRIQQMQRASMTALGAGHYSAAQIAAALAHVPLTDAALIDEGHFFVIEEAGRGLVATGGWSRAQPGYAAHQKRPVPSTGHGGATVRQVFVHPARARRGLGACILRLIEADATAAGIDRLTLSATLAGVPLYRARGYIETGAADILLPGGVPFPLLGMAKHLAPGMPLAA